MVALGLEKGGKGSLRELVTTVRAFARFRPFEIERPDDGAFEVITIRHAAKWKILGTALKASLRGLGPQPSATEYAFTTVKAMPIQIDGEVMDLDANTHVRIDIAPKALRTVL